LFFLAKFVVTRIVPSRRDKVHLVLFYAGISVVILGILHGASALKVLVIILMNYWLVKAGAGRLGFVVALWAFNGSVLFANEKQGGYHFTQLHESLAFLVRVHGCA
jgi:hypothetical protein